MLGDLTRCVPMQQHAIDIEVLQFIDQVAIQLLPGHVGRVERNVVVG